MKKRPSEFRGVALRDLCLMPARYGVGAVFFQPGLFGDSVVSFVVGGAVLVADVVKGKLINVREDK